MGVTARRVPVVRTAHAREVPELRREGVHVALVAPRPRGDEDSRLIEKSGNGPGARATETRHDHRMGEGRCRLLRRLGNHRRDEGQDARGHRRRGTGTAGASASHRASSRW